MKKQKIIFFIIRALFFGACYSLAVFLSQKFFNSNPWMLFVFVFIFALIATPIETYILKKIEK